MRNTGQDHAAGGTMRDTLPANATYVPGSLQVVSGPNAGAKTALVYGSGLLLMRLPSLSPTSATRPHRRRWFELPLRGAAVAAFVLTLLLQRWAPGT